MKHLGNNISYKFPEIENEMKNCAEMVKEIEDQIVIRASEIERLQKAILALTEEAPKGFSIIENKNPLPITPTTYAGYPLDGTLVAKMNFLENFELRMWKTSEMITFIKKAEPNTFEETIKSFKQRLDVAVRRGELVRMKYNNSKRNCFYCTRKEWIEKIPYGDTFIYRLPDNYKPSSQFLSKLTKEQLDPVRISWSIQ